MAGAQDEAGPAIVPSRRGVGPAAIAVTAVGLLIALATGVLWVRDEPFERRLAALERTCPGDPEVLLHRALEAGDPARIGGAASLLRDGGAAALWCGSLWSFGQAAPPECDEALALWRQVEPDNPLPDVLAASFALDRLGRAGRAGDGSLDAPAALLESALARTGAPEMHGDRSLRLHASLQERLGTRDPVAAVRHAYAGACPHVTLRLALYFERTRAEIDAYAGRLDAARARCERALGFVRRLRGAASSGLTAVVADALLSTVADLDARAALLEGDVARARALAAEVAACERAQQERGVGAERWRPVGGWPGPFALQRGTGLRGEPARLWAMLRLKLSREAVFTAFDPEDQAERFRRDGAAMIASGAAQLAPASRALDLALADPEAFGPPSSMEEAPPRGLLEALARGAPEPSYDALVALPLARRGASALPAIAALEKARRDRLEPHLLPCLVAARDPGARGAILRTLGGEGFARAPAATAVAVEMLGDVSLLEALRARSAARPQGMLYLDQLAALDHAIRSLEARRRASAPR